MLEFKYECYLCLGTDSGFWAQNSKKIQLKFSFLFWFTHSGIPLNPDLNQDPNRIHNTCHRHRTINFSTGPPPKKNCNRANCTEQLDLGNKATIFRCHDWNRNRHRHLLFRGFCWPVEASGRKAGRREGQSSCCQGQPWPWTCPGTGTCSWAWSWGWTWGSWVGGGGRAQCRCEHTPHTGQTCPLPSLPEHNMKGQSHTDTVILQQGKYCAGTRNYDKD